MRKHSALLIATTMDHISKPHEVTGTSACRTGSQCYVRHGLEQECTVTQTGISALEYGHVTHVGGCSPLCWAMRSAGNGVVRCLTCITRHDT